MGEFAGAERSLRQQRLAWLPLSHGHTPLGRTLAMTTTFWSVLATSDHLRTPVVSWPRDVRPYRARTIYRNVSRRRLRRGGRWIGDDTAMARPQKATHTHDAMGRPRHRLFGVFDDPTVGRDAIEKLAPDLHAKDDMWVLFGEEGLQRLDVSGGMEGLRGRIVRIVELAMSSDIGYLRTLEAALESGGLVVSIPVANADAAKSLADLLSASSGHSFAYFSNWEFQPVAGGLA